MDTNTLRQKLLPEYGTEVLHELLKQEKFTHVSFRQKSVPSWGSPTRKIPPTAKNLECEKVIVHHADSFGKREVTRVTIKVKDDGYYQYIKL